MEIEEKGDRGIETIVIISEYKNRKIKIQLKTIFFSKGKEIELLSKYMNI